MDDIRIKFSLIGHPKLEKLKIMIGGGALEYLVTLWIRVAQNNPKGKLTDLDEVDIAIYAGWKGDPLVFLSALKNCRFLEDNGEGYEIKDWEDHQPFAFYSRERSEIAKKNIAQRWGNKKGKKRNTNSIQTVYKADTPIPIPSPIPSPKDIRIRFDKEVPIPKNFCLTNNMVQYGKIEKRYNHSLYKFTEEFILSCKSKNYRYKNWYAAWQKWLLKDIEWHPERQDKLRDYK